MTGMAKTVAFIGLFMSMGVFVACGSTSASNNNGSYDANRSAQCLRSKAQYTKYANYNRKPFAFEVLGPSSHETVFEAVKDAKVLVVEFEKHNAVPLSVGLRFFEDSTGAKRYYRVVQAPYVKQGAPLAMIVLKKNVVLTWQVTKPKSYVELINRCMKT